MEFVSLLVPLLLSSIALVLFKHKLTWFEIIIPIIVAAIAISICKSVMVDSLTEDVEYLTSYPVKVRYFEDWNERVSCRHPKYCYRTETYRYKCGKSTCTGVRTVQYQCGWKHPYDVDYHPEYWDIKYNTGYTKRISKSKYDYYLKWWTVNPYYVNMNRRFHTNDGDSYQADWTGKLEHVEPYVIKHKYENKVQAVNSVFHFRNLDSIELKKVKDYPPIKDNKQRSCIGCSDADNKKLEQYNALFGLKHQIRAYIIILDDPLEESAELQQIYWRGGNKNEIVVCINKDYKWVKTFSWSDDKRLESELNYLFAKKNLTISTKIDEMFSLVPDLWKRKNFSDFDYIKVPLTNSQLITIFIIVTILSLICLTIGILNDINPYY